MVETLGYGLIATAIVGASLYGLARYAESGAPAATSQPEQAARSPVSRAPQSVTIAPPISLAARPSAPTENYVRTKDKIYYLASASPAQMDSDIWNAMRRNCYAAANMNRDGEYPALQQSACTRFADFGRQKGWDTGVLPAYGTLKPKPQQQVAYQGQAESDNSGECASLLQEGQNIEAAMRAGYQEPLGNWYRGRLREVEERLWKLHCPKR